MEVKVFFIKNCYRFCIDNSEIKFKEIIEKLNGSISSEDKEDICKGEPLFVVDFIKDEDSSKGNNSLSYSLEVIKNKNDIIVKNEKNKIKLVKNVEQNKYSIPEYRNGEEFLCETLLLALKDIIEPMLPTLKTVVDAYIEDIENINEKNKTEVESLEMK